MPKLVSRPHRLAAVARAVWERLVSDDTRLEKNIFHKMLTIFEKMYIINYTLVGINYIIGVTIVNRFDNCYH